MDYLLVYQLFHFHFHVKRKNINNYNFSKIISFRMLFVVYSELSDSTSHAMNSIIDLSVILVGFIYFIVRYLI